MVAKFGGSCFTPQDRTEVIQEKRIEKAREAIGAKTPEEAKTLIGRDKAAKATYYEVLRGSI